MAGFRAMGRMVGCIFRHLSQVGDTNMEFKVSRFKRLGRVVVRSIDHQIFAVESLMP